MSTGAIVAIVIVVILAIIILLSAVKVFPEYQRGVIFRLGRLMPPKGPGLFFIIPVVDRVVRVDLRTITYDVPAQEVITKDNVPAKVNAVAYFRVIDPSKSVVEVQNYIAATSQISQTTLRSVLGQSDLDHLLTERDKLNARLQEIIDEQTDPWGVKVSIVEIKDVEIPATMQRAMARQAEAETGAASQGHRRRGRVPGLGEAITGSGGLVPNTRRDPVALPADPGRDSDGEELDDGVPHTDRPHRTVSQEAPVLIGSEWGCAARYLAPAALVRLLPQGTARHPPTSARLNQLFLASG